MAIGEKKHALMEGSTTAAMVGAAPAGSGENGKLTAADAGARPDNWMPTAAEVGAVSLKLLWENKTLPSDFPAQKVSLNLTDYPYVAILISYGGTNRTDQLHFVRNGAVNSDLICRNRFNSGAWFTRGVAVSDTGVEFSTGLHISFKTEEPWYSRSEKAYAAKPVAIYGVKGIEGVTV